MLCTVLRTWTTNKMGMPPGVLSGSAMDSVREVTGQAIFSFFLFSLLRLFCIPLCFLSTRYDISLASIGCGQPIRVLARQGIAV
jgi:hypothetical protein